MEVPSNRMRSNSQKLMNGKFYLNMRKTFSVEVTEHWNTLPREGTEFP